MKKDKLYYKIIKSNRKSFNGEVKEVFTTRLAYDYPVRRREFLSVCKRISGMKCHDVNEVLSFVGCGLYNCLLSCSQVDVPYIGRFRLASRSRQVDDLKDAGPDTIERIVLEYQPFNDLKQLISRENFIFEERHEED